ncbi:MAG: hypothetical protein RLZZ297_2111 [Chloroflexota bacterium]|jgi:peptidoglycan/LPS O-acetylase OafA/YrhL
MTRLLAAIGTVLVLGLLWAAPLPYRLDIGRFDSGAVQGFYDPEYGAGTSFRWSGAQASLQLPGVGAGAYDLVVSASSLTPQRLRTTADGAVSAVVVQPGFRAYTTPQFHPWQLAPLTVELAIPAAASDGRRVLGVAVDEVRLLPRGWLLPPPVAWAHSVALVWLLAGVLRHRQWRLHSWQRLGLATMLVAALIVGRRGDAAAAVHLGALCAGLALAVRWAQVWRRPLREVLPWLAVAVAVGVIAWRGAVVFVPLWQALVLVGSVALLRLRRWWWGRLRPFRTPLTIGCLAVAALQAWPVAVGGALLWLGSRVGQRSGRGALLIAWAAVVERVDWWLAGRRVPVRSTAGRQYWDGFALLRGVVVLVVMLGHTPTLAVYAPALVVDVVHWGVRIAVEGFFLLSGWLIGDVLLRSLASWRDPRALALFVHRRWMRTLPLYWAVLLLVALAGWSGATLADLASYAVFIQNIVAPHPPFFLVAWSLSIEEWFYLLAALLLAAGARRWQPRTALLLTLGLLLVVPAALRSWAALATPWSVTDVIRQLVPFRLDAIAAGVALVWAWRSWPALTRWRGRIAVSGVLVGAGFVAVVQTVPGWETVGWVRVALIPVLTLTTLSLFPWVAGVTRPRPTGFERWLTGVSAMSYPLYLLHYPLRQTLVGIGGVVGASLWVDLVVTVAYALGALWIARRWHHEVEEPLLRLRMQA